MIRSGITMKSKMSKKRNHLPLRQNSGNREIHKDTTQAIKKKKSPSNGTEKKNKSHPIHERNKGKKEAKDQKSQTKNGMSTPSV